MSTEIIYNTYDNEASIVHDDIVNDKVLKVVTAPFGDSNIKDVLEYPLAENLLEVQSYGFSQFIKVSFFVRKAEVILSIDDEDIVVAEAENIEMNHWNRLEGFFTMDELKKVDFNNATLRLRITKAFNDPEIYIYRPCLTKGDTIPDWFPSLEEIMGDIVESQSSLFVDKRLGELASDLTLLEQYYIKTKLNISEGQLRRIGSGYGLQHQVSAPNNYGTLGYNAVNFSYSSSSGDYGATGRESHAEGNNTTASGDRSHAEGYGARAFGDISHAEGFDTEASGNTSHAEGYRTTASGNMSHSEGVQTTASGSGSHAEGRDTISSGNMSHAEGSYTVAGSLAENARGTYNEIITPISTTAFNPNDVIESVGVGNQSTRKNALTRWKNGAFKWLLQPLTNITNAVLGFHAADENGRLNYHNGTEWKKYLLEGEEGEEVDLSNYYNQQEVDGLLVGKEDAITKNTAFNKDFGVGTNDVARGDHTHPELHTHTNKSTLDGITPTKVSEWDSKAEGNHTHPELHTHSNKGVLDTITAQDLADYFEAHEKTVTGVSFTGDVNKTLTITRQDGTTLTASFVDKEGDGGGVTDGVLNTLEFNTTTGELTATVLNDTTEIPIDVNLDGRYSLITHTHQLSDVNGLVDALNDKVGLLGDETIQGKKTFSTVPDSSQDAANPNDLIRKSQWDAYNATATTQITQGLAGKENISNKKTAIETNKASNTFYPSIKAVYDWAVAKFLDLRLENLASDLDEAEQDDIKVKLNIGEGGELKKIGDGYGLQHQIDNPDYYGTLGANAVNLSFSEDEWDYGATGMASHAEGRLTKSSGNYSHAEGLETTASGYGSHAEGELTMASGEASHAEGFATRASGTNSHAEGLYTTASGDLSHAEGRNTTAGSYGENARGLWNEIITPISTTGFDANDVIESVGVGTSNPTRKNALTRWKNGAFKWLLQPLSNITNAVIGFHASDETGRLNYHDGTEWKKYLIDGEEGSGELKKIGDGYGLQHQIDNPDNYGTLGANATNLSYNPSVGNYGATGDYSHIEGLRTTASGEAAHAEGARTAAFGDYAHAEGYQTTASGDYAHAEGRETTASTDTSHAEGYRTTASGEYGSHAEGVMTTASGMASHAEGYNTFASGDISHAAGYGLSANSYAENARGVYHEIITPISATSFNARDVIESVGVGTSMGDRKNALTRWKNGAFKWLLQPLTNITNAVIGFHAADEEGRLNYHNGTEWKKYALEGEGGGEVDLSNYYDKQEVDGLLVGKEDAITKNTAFNKKFGTGSNDVARGDHSHNQYLLTKTFEDRKEFIGRYEDPITTQTVTFASWERGTEVIITYQGADMPTIVNEDSMWTLNFLDMGIDFVPNQKSRIYLHIVERDFGTNEMYIDITVKPITLL